MDDRYVSTVIKQIEGTQETPSHTDSEPHSQHNWLLYILLTTSVTCLLIAVTMFVGISSLIASIFINLA